MPFKLNDEQHEQLDNLLTTYAGARLAVHSASQISSEAGMRQEKRANKCFDEVVHFIEQVVTDYGSDLLAEQINEKDIVPGASHRRVVEDNRRLEALVEIATIKNPHR